jgi:DNA-binding NarL/FixJ family response regulator
MVDLLTPGDRALLDHVLQGNTTAAIAQRLGVTEASARGRLARLFRKLMVENRTQATVWALTGR